MPDSIEELSRIEDLLPVVEPGVTPAGLTGPDRRRSTLKHPEYQKTWLLFLALATVGLGALTAGLSHYCCEASGSGDRYSRGLGIDIASFVWWIGIGHAGTLISAILLLLHQGWRNSSDRFAERDDAIRRDVRGMYPLAHLGPASYLFYWLLPYPNNMSVWPQFRSPLVWDVFAVSTYFTVSLIFWYSALIPDFATLRDKATRRSHQYVYGFFRWAGAARPPLAGISRARICCWPASRRARALGPYRGELRFRGSPSFPGGTASIFPPLLRRGRHLLRPSQW